jgi:hypothetical protein
MTNQELMREIRELRTDMKEAHIEQAREIADLKKEFYLFKGKAFGFISILTTGIGFLIDYIKHKP